VEVLNLHLDIDVEFHVRTLRNMELQDFDLAGCDLVYARDNG
jgi:hypothetical protein